MNKNNQQDKMERITLEQARKSISEMNLINGFLFDSTLEDEDDAKIIVGNILKAVFFREFNIRSITSQKPIQAIDTKYHGIRLDVKIDETEDGKAPTATIYDIEMEDRQSDRKYLPNRLRFYNALYDAKLLESGDEYDKLPDFVSIVILSYDPFGAGDMYYEAMSTLITHPDIPYENGIRNIFLYCNGMPNFDDPNGKISLPPEHSKKLKEMLKYIVSGEKPILTNIDIDEIDTIVTRVKGREEVTKAYMRQWDRELSIKRDAKNETKQEDAIKDICFDIEHNIPIEITRKRLKENFGYDSNTIDELIKQAKENKELVLNAGI